MPLKHQSLAAAFNSLFGLEHMARYILLRHLRNWLWRVVVCFGLGLPTPSISELFAQDSSSPFDCLGLTTIVRTAVRAVASPNVDDIARNVARDADTLQLSSVALLGRYFRNGEHGLGRDERFGFCLVYRAVEGGYALGAYEVAKKYVALRDYDNAVKYYGILFGWAYVYEGLEMTARIRDPLKPEPGSSHRAYAEVNTLIADGRITRAAAARPFREGTLIGVGMSTDEQRMFQRMFQRNR